MASTNVLGARTRGRDNAFDVLRLLGAALVLVSHSFALAGDAEPRLGDHSLGVIGVEIFFAISGFLVTASWLSEPRVRAFLVKRALRILPALVVTVVLSAFVLGPLLSTLSTGEYLRDARPYTYVIDNVGAVVGAGTVWDVAYTLPGVFAGLPSDAVNGSLWTLPVEVRAYLLVLVLGLVGLLAKRLWIVAALGLLALAPGASESTLLLVVFLVSALMYVKRDSIPLDGRLALAALLVWLIAMWAPHAQPLVAIAAPYVVLYAAYRAPAGVRTITRRGDVSYGLYLLAFPVQQLLLELLGAGTSPYLLTLIALPVTYALATLSWRLVERPALRLKSMLAGPRQEAPARRPEPQPTPVLP